METIKGENLEFNSVKEPKVVGGYRFGNNKSYFSEITLTYKPSWFHRKMMKLCLGMYWFDKV